MKLCDALERLQKSQLQVYFQYWFPETAKDGTRDQLVRKLLGAMGDPSKICRRFDALKPPERSFIESLLVLADATGTVTEVRAQKPSRRIQDFEVETILRRLKEQGFIHKADGARGARADCFTIPDEIVAALRGSVDVDDRAPLELISRAAVSPDAPIAEEFPDGEAVAARVAALKDGALKAVVKTTLEDHGGILPLSAWRRAGGRERLHTPEWRAALEAQGLGTTGMLNLKSFGVEIEEEALCVYQEAVIAHSRANARTNGSNGETTIRTGSDLIVDLNRLLQLLYIQPLELTREGTLYRRMEEKLKQEFVLASYGGLGEGRLLELLVTLATKLKLVERTDGRLQVQMTRVKAWERKDVVARVKRILEVFQKEHTREHYSFHQKFLREIALEELGKLVPEQFVAARGFVRTAVARFLCSLKTLPVSAAFTERLERNVVAEALFVPLERLYYDLYHWLVHRLGLLGIADLGYRDGHLESLALSSLGAMILGRAGAAEGQTGGLLINPDFEILQFPGSEKEAEEAFTLSRFAERIGADCVKRYRLTRESVKRAILAGMPLASIVSFLETHARAPVPGNVIYTLGEWADGLELVRRQRAVALRSITPEGMDRLAEALKEGHFSFERVAPTVTLLFGDKAEQTLLGQRERLQEDGIYID
jgi:hypothetical protein